MLVADEDALAAVGVTALEDQPVLVRHRRVDGDLTTLTVRLLGSLPEGPFGAEALTVLRAVVTDDRIPLDGAIVDTVADIVAATQGLTEDPSLTADWWARVERLRPDVRGPWVRLRAE
jgi:hypothetical protein